MKEIARGLIFLLVLGGASQSAAEFLSCSPFKPFIGADYMLVAMKGKGDYHLVFPHSFPNATIYAGAKYHPNFGFELGMDFSPRRSHTWTLPAGQPFFGSTVRRTISGITKVRRAGGHLDWMVFLPLPECFELFGSIGYGYLKPKITVGYMTLNPGVTRETSALASVYGKGQSVFRIGLGTNFMAINDLIGLRVKIGWETTSALRVSGNALFSQLGYDSKGFTNSVTAAAGAFVRF